MCHHRGSRDEFSTAHFANERPFTGVQPFVNRHRGELRESLPALVTTTTKTSWNQNTQWNNATELQLSDGDLKLRDRYVQVNETHFHETTHEYGLSPVWDLLWHLNASLLANAFPQISQTNDFSPVCIVRWIRKSTLVRNPLPQTFERQFNLSYTTRYTFVKIEEVETFNLPRTWTVSLRCVSSGGFEGNSSTRTICCTLCKKTYGCPCPNVFSYGTCTILEMFYEIGSKHEHKYFGTFDIKNLFFLGMCYRLVTSSNETPSANVAHVRLHPQVSVRVIDERLLGFKVLTAGNARIRLDVWVRTLVYP